MKMREVSRVSCLPNAFEARIDWNGYGAPSSSVASQLSPSKIRTTAAPPEPIRRGMCSASSSSSRCRGCGVGSSSNDHHHQQQPANNGHYLIMLSIHISGSLGIGPKYCLSPHVSLYVLASVRVDATVLVASVCLSVCVPAVCLQGCLLALVHLWKIVFLHIR